MKIIDFRSDTVTQQTPQMREAMFTAAVGDDVYGDDPSVNALETYAKELFGSEAALFVSSGTMGNQLALMAHTERGEEVLTHHGSHIFQHEQASTSVLSQCKINPIIADNDHLTPELIARNCHGNSLQDSKTACIEYENALSNGTVYTLQEMQAIDEIAQKLDIPVHCDGARIFNAMIAMDSTPKEIFKLTDSLTFCLSKGLAAPVGSLLLGTEAFITKARKYRKLIGGGLRQSGFMAAAGLVALKTMIPRLQEDHDNALHLAKGLENSGLFTPDYSKLEINLVSFTLKEPLHDFNALQAYCEQHGVIIRPGYHGVYRFVTHYGITTQDIDDFLAILDSYKATLI